MVSHKKQKQYDENVWEFSLAWFTQKELLQPHLPSLRDAIVLSPVMKTNSHKILYMD